MATGQAFTCFSAIPVKDQSASRNCNIEAVTHNLNGEIEVAGMPRTDVLSV
jgi:hypothetical protein